jgi:hypothetical protein
MTPSKTLIVASLAASVVLAGCATGPKGPAPLYGWSGYESNLDTYFRQDQTGLDGQIQSMETNKQKILSANQALPPGYQAHLGLLYGKQGNMARFQQDLTAEKQQFPEAASFVDFLLRSFKSK